MLCFSVMLMNMPNPLLRQLGEFWFAEGTNLFGAIVYFSVGVILLILSAVLCTKRDMSKEKYYYSFANYLFATVSSGMYLIWMFASVNSILMYVLAIASAAIIWYLLVCYGKSKTLDLLKAKKRK